MYALLGVPVRRGERQELALEEKVFAFVVVQSFCVRSLHNRRGHCETFFSCGKCDRYSGPRFSGILKRELWDHGLDSKLRGTAAQAAGARSLTCFIET